MEHCTGRLLLRNVIIRDKVSFWIHRADVGGIPRWSGGFQTQQPFELASGDRIELDDARRGLVKLTKVRPGKREGTCTVEFEIVGALK